MWYHCAPQTRNMRLGPLMESIAWFLKYEQFILEDIDVFGQYGDFISLLFLVFFFTVEPILWPNIQV